MKKYIIEYTTKVNGENIKLYHCGISINKNKETMNRYVENLTTDIKLAIVFYDSEEANKISLMFFSDIHIPKIITL